MFKKFLSAVILCSSIVPNAFAGLIGFYDLNGNGNESTGTGLNLTEEGSQPVSYVAGLDGLAASFDGTGSSWLRAAVDTSGNRVPNFTWGSWVKLNDPTAWNIFLSNDNGNWDRFTQVQNGFWSVSSVPSKTAGNGTNGVANSSVAATSDWTFVAQTFDGTNQNLYVNGVLAGTFVDSVAASQNFIDIGRNANSAYPLNGLMDGVFFFDETLTAQQIATINAGGADGSGVRQVANVPEPSSIAMLSMALLALAFRRTK